MYTRLCILFLFFCPLTVGEDEITDPSEKLTDPEETTKPLEIDASRFFTDTLITGQDSVVKCKARVHESREAARTRGLDHGVNPSVGLGAALVIFLLVGVFAAIIAQGFQKVSP
ncbi:uncharacterized protein LOC111700535 [Eurytemora carolleeae]|uniref:uncharacterized protein LOC111700535 n=1 Tax=Eurytemora carolleeae TaxID=1294199 RepID=UPI000C763B55|nr:uncharacterized protein LOC111700535 [Eurytemora carolleeae]|eukprot:XP_023327242.1 uncharacterized protein LOC111700535 [Eurytemora affinis]